MRTSVSNRFPLCDGTSLVTLTTYTPKRQNHDLGRSWRSPYDGLCFITQQRFLFSYVIKKAYVKAPHALFGQNFRIVLGGLSRCFNCSIPRVRFASYHPTRETLKRARLCTLLSPQLSLSHPRQSKSFSFRFIQY